MKKKFSSMWRVAIALVMVLSLNLVMAAPASAAEEGTISLDAEWYGTGTVTGEAVGTGDGSTTIFNLDNTVVVAASEKIYLAGVLQVDPADYGLTDATGVIIFAETPVDGAAITADYTYVTNSDDVLITVEDADLNVPKTYPDETFDPDGSTNLFIVTGTPMSPWPANPVTVMDMAGTSYSVASVNTQDGEVTLLVDPPDIAELMAVAVIPAVDLNLDVQPYQPTTLIVTLNAAPGGAYTVDVTITGVIAITGEAVGSTAGGAFTGFLGNTDVVAGTVSLTIGAETFSDDGLGVLTGSVSGTGTIAYDTGALIVTDAGEDIAFTADYDYTDSELVPFGSGDNTLTTSAMFRSVDTDGVDVVESDPLSASADVTITATNFVYITYTGAQANEATVNIKSDSDAPGIAVTLTETDVDTGIFTGTVTLVAAESNESASELQAAHGDTVTATYTDVDPAAPRTAVATVDDVPPAISNESPFDGEFIDDSTPLFSVEVTDPDAEITYGEWYVEIDTVDVTADLSVSPIADGYRLEYLMSSPGLTTGPYVWQVDVNDKIGTHRILEFEFTYDETAPELTTAVTGWTWDAEGEAAEDTNSRTTIMATFSEPLDEATVAASDFLVADLVTPSAAEVHGVYVFLTISEMATDATPSVELVGEVSDIAGNPQTTGLIDTAEDNIDPILTVGVDPSLGKDATVITVTVTSSEALTGLPTVEVTEADGDVISVTMTGTDTPWEGTYTLAEANLDGVYAVTALGTDEAANDSLGVTTISAEVVGTGDGAEQTFTATLVKTPIVPTSLIVTDGIETLTDSGDGTLTGDGSGTINYNTGALSVTFNTAPTDGTDVTAGYDYFEGASATFEGDFTDPTVTFSPADGGSVTTTSPWIMLQFDEDVEVLEAIFDGANVTEELYLVGEAQYMLATTGLAMGDHTISVLAVDLAGNEMAVPDSATFTVVVAPPATIELFPGWNLISLPLIPDDPGIEAVLDGVTVDTVWGYDPVTSPGDPWATYKPGVIEDDLTEMVDGMGYWIYMTSPATLTVSGVETPEPPALPPTYDVVSGWNLIGFKSIEAIDNDVYLANIFPYTVLWGYEADEGYFSVHPMNEHPEGGDEPLIGDMEVGHGYWLWATSEGIIVLPQ